MEVERVREQLKPRRGGSDDSRLLCIIYSNMHGSGRCFRLPSEDDEQRANKASGMLVPQEPFSHGLPPIPNGKLNHLRGFFNVVLYGITEWGNAFSPRQLLTLTTLVRLVKRVAELSEGVEGFSTALQTCLALAIDRQADRLSTFARWDSGWSKISNTFGRQALPMVWDYAEANPFSGATGDWEGAVEWVVEVVETNSCLTNVGVSQSSSATELPLPDASVSAVVTDPPYYSAVPYADLSDFFYSWLKRSLHGKHVELLKGDLTPKEDECISMAHRAAMYRNKDAAWFEKMMGYACAECCRVTNLNGVGVFVFASKETKAWEAMLGALVLSGWMVTSSWSIDTEMGSRLRAQNSAVLASSIHIVARPRQGREIGEWRDVLQELPRRISEWLPRLADEGIVGADAIFACLGPALEIYSRYSRVERSEGSPVTLREYLMEVWAAVAKEALSLLFKGADASGLEPDARLTAMWLWTLRTGTNGNGSSEGDTEDDASDDAVTDYEDAQARPSKSGGYTLEYDAVRKIGQGLGADLESLESVVEVKGKTARLLSVAERETFLFAGQKSSVAVGQSGSSTETAKAPKRGKSKRPARGQQAFAVDDEGRLSAQAASGRTDRVDAVSEPEVPSNWTTAETVLDRVHQAMLLFGKGRSDALKRLLVDDGIGKEARFWKLAQSLSALYPPGTDEKRWVDGVLARKKGLGF